MTDTGIDYSAALRECGYDAAAVATGLRMLEDQNVASDFRMAVTLLRMQGHQPGLREHLLAPILDRMALEEAGAAIMARGQRAAAAHAAAEAERRDRQEAAARRSHEMSETMSWLIENMTDDELQERVPFRPHVAEGWRRYLTLRAEEQQQDEGRVCPEIEEQLQALDVGSRLRLTRSAPAPAVSIPVAAGENLDESIQAGLMSAFNLSESAAQKVVDGL